ncbi:METTL21B, partial [Symbiodinium microadriaticum]
MTQAIAALRSVGMTVEGKIAGPLLRAPLSSDAASLSEREIRASEITTFLRIALKSVCDEERIKRISSHSLKRTPLAWCAKFGVAEPVRSVLGRHVSATAGSQAIYAVDLATSAVKEFEQVLGRISSGSFNPDNPRAEYFVSAASTPPVAPQGDEVKAEAEEPDAPMPTSPIIVVGSDSESSSVSSDSDTGSSSEDEAPPAKVVRSEWPWSLDKALMHAKSKKCHYVMAKSGGGNAILACGKVGSGNYVAPASFDQAHFKKRCSEVKLSDAAFGQLTALGITTLGTAAHTVGTPGQDIPDALIREWIETNTPGLPLGDVAALKRIFFESQTLVLSSLRQSILDPDATTKQKLPEAEKSQRLSAFKAANPGLFLDATSEPGHSLLELACEQERQNVLQHIPIEKCVSRQHEILNHQKPSKMLELEAGHIAVKETSEVPEQPVHGALALLEGLKRRGYAYVMARCVSLAPYEAYLAKLMQHFRRAPPPNHQRVGIDQLIDADKMVFVYLLEQGVKPRAKADGSYELDSALHDALNSYQVSSLLLPLPAGKTRNDQNAQIPIPLKLRQLGGRALTKNGLRICFGYNLEGDVLPVSGQCIYFDAHLRHATMPWSGRRVVLAGFVIKGYEAISAIWSVTVISLLSSGRSSLPRRFLTFALSESPLTTALSAASESASHTHLPWGTNSSGFATKEETAYPPPLAAQIATAIARHLVDCEWSPPEALPQPHSLLTACRAAVNEQPKSSKFPALVPEHCAVVLVKGPRSVLSALPCAPMARIKCPWPVPAACSCKLSVIPAEAQLLRSILAPKRLVLWREIMEDLGYKDVAVFNEVVEGTNLLGLKAALTMKSRKNLWKSIRPSHEVLYLFTDAAYEAGRKLVSLLLAVEDMA